MVDVCAYLHGGNSTLNRRHVVFGSGPLGRAVAREVAAQGESVRLLSRRPTEAIAAAIAAVDMSSVGYLWICALNRRRDRLLRGAFVVLALQGFAVVLRN